MALPVNIEYTIPEKPNSRLQKYRFIDREEIMF